MARETTRIRYTRLFEVRLLHHYWLDDGRTVFDSLNEATRTKRLLTYDVRQILSVAPDPATVGRLNGLGGVFRTTGLGFVVAVPQDSVVPTDASFTFHATVVAADYPNYTALSLRPRGEVHRVEKSTVADQPDVIHRYKENVPVLSNATGTMREAGGVVVTRFLSRPPVDGEHSGDGVEALVTVGGELHQLAGDPPDGLLVPLGPADALPVYVHQGDVPELTPPTGGPLRGIELAPDTPPTVALVIRLDAHVADEPDRSFVGDDGRPVPRVFEVRLRNRWTYWEYHDRHTGAVTGPGRELLPLTWFGNAGGREKPSTAAIHIEWAAADPALVKELVSPIFIQPPS